MSYAEQVEHIEVHGQRSSFSIGVATEQVAPSADVGEWLKSLPGADVNRNGPVSGIAQYRGLYGDRVNVSVAGRPVVGAGPNSMDAPLSYAPDVLIQSLVVDRGVAPVSRGLNTLGGAVTAEFYLPAFSATGDLTSEHLLRGGYRDNGGASELAFRSMMAQDDHALLLFGEDLCGREDQEDGDGREISPTEYHKRSAGVNYQHQLSNGQIGADYQYLNTKDAGTPALPMDIDYILTHRSGLSGRYELYASDIQWQIGYSDAEHAMDNHRMRSNGDPARYRKNNANSDAWDARISWQQSDDFGAIDGWQIGFDLLSENHDAVITNPNNSLFRIDNFNDVDQHHLGLFAQWHGQLNDWSIVSGGRIKYLKSDSGEVSHSMALMNPNIRELVERFNNSDREQSDWMLDLALNASYPLADNWLGQLGLGVKQRPASYQERYLWLPMQSTGGLADGKTYVGDVELDPETAWQIDVGVDYQSREWQISPRVFYQRIDDYIQGTPSEDPVVQQVAMMMGDDSPLQFSNVDAELYGLDLLWHLDISHRWRLGGQATYVRGERRDIDDNLYRVSPPNMSLYGAYQSDLWQAKLDWRGYMSQDDVSETNQEQETAGYGILGAEVVFQPDTALALRAGVSNLFDQAYQDHLAGYNRVSGSELAVGERLPGDGRTVWCRAEYVF
ncbi:TonB-dependent receptor [Corallincola platygyrae]